MTIQQMAQRLVVRARVRFTPWRLRHWITLGMLAVIGILGVSLWSVAPAWSTAPQPPRLVPAILNGNPIHVLYITRSNDQVLVRCYPGFQPALERINQEGRLTCINPSPQ